MIDMSTEPLISFNHAARLLPPGPRGGPVNLSTIFRWVTEGTRGIRLEAIRLGGRWYTSKESLQRFAERLTQAALPEQPVSFPSAGERGQQAGAAPRPLEGRGC